MSEWRDLRIPVRDQRSGSSLLMERSMLLTGGLAEETLSLIVPDGNWQMEWYDLGISRVEGTVRITVQVRRGSVTTVLNVGECAGGTIFNGVRGAGPLTLEGADTVSFVMTYGVAGMFAQAEMFLRRLL